jgi:hypothetical protein
MPKKNPVLDTMKGFGGEASISNLLVGVRSRGFGVEQAQLLMQSALTNGQIELNEEMRAVLPRKRTQ